jgi:single-strand DNA-binding protein
MLNEVVLIGTLLNDPVVKKSKNGKWVALFTVKVKRTHKSDKHYDMLPCIFNIDNYDDFEEQAVKDTPIVVKGSIHNNNYTDKNGNYVYGQEINVNYCRLLNENYKY